MHSHTDLTLTDSQSHTPLSKYTHTYTHTHTKKHTNSHSCTRDLSPRSVRYTSTQTHALNHTRTRSANTLYVAKVTHIHKHKRMHAHTQIYENIQTHNPIQKVFLQLHPLSHIHTQTHWLAIPFTCSPSRHAHTHNHANGQTHTWHWISSWYSKMSIRHAKNKYRWTFTWRRT